MAALTPAAAEGLVAALQRAQAELEWVAVRLEEEFAEASRKGRDINTLSLLTRLNRLRRWELNPVCCQPTLQTRWCLSPATYNAYLQACNLCFKRAFQGSSPPR